MVCSVHIHGHGSPTLPLERELLGERWVCLRIVEQQEEGDFPEENGFPLFVGKYVGYVCVCVLCLGGSGGSPQ